MKIGIAIIAASVMIALPLCAQQPRPGNGGTQSPVSGMEAIAGGRSLFSQNCTGCHGAHGEGGQGEGQGPNLVNSWLVRGANDRQLFGYIHNGVPGSAMPPFSSLPDRQIWQLVAFVRSLNSPAIAVPVSGNAQTGQAIFFGKGKCASCHMIRGQGGFLGPDLSNVGATERLDELREAILRPGSLSLDGYSPVILKTADGKSVEGIAKHYTNWSIQILDQNGRLHLLRGEEMKGVSFQHKPWMPDDYSKRLTAGEIQDLLAFLSRQSTRPQSAAQPSSRPDSNSRPAAE